MRPTCPVRVPNDIVCVITTCREYRTSRSSHCTSFNLRFNFLTQVALTGFCFEMSEEMHIFLSITQRIFFSFVDKKFRFCLELSLYGFIFLFSFTSSLKYALFVSNKIQGCRVTDYVLQTNNLMSENTSS
jgi:hypothetical protein